MSDELRVRNQQLKTPNPLPVRQAGELRTGNYPLRMVAWELTRGCNLACVHCRASAERGPYSGELSTEECFRVMDEIASFSKPVIILTGGEPLLRKDIFDLARYGSEKGFRMVMATNGTLITEKMVKMMKASGIQRISVSLDGPTPETHDAFRKVRGAFEGSLRGIEIAKKEMSRIPDQYNRHSGKPSFDPRDPPPCALSRCSGPPHLPPGPHGKGKGTKRSGDIGFGLRKNPPLVL